MRSPRYKPSKNSSKLVEAGVEVQTTQFLLWPSPLTHLGGEVSWLHTPQRGQVWPGQMRDPVSAGPRWHRALGADIRTGERIWKRPLGRQLVASTAGGLQNGVCSEGGTGSELFVK